MSTFDAERIAFVFGPDVRADVLDDLEDPSDLDERSYLYDEYLPEAMTGARGAARQVIANQILDDEPPEVWATAQRLVAAGIEPESAFGQLAMVFATQLRDALAEDRVFDPDAYATALGRLPIPEGAEVEAALVERAGAQPGIELDALEAQVIEVLGGDPDDPVLEALLDAATDHLLGIGVLELLAGDRVVSPFALTHGLVLTHRLTEYEQRTGVLDLAFDLPIVAARELLELADGSPVQVAGEHEHDLLWVGPDGWLDRYPPGDLLAVRVEDVAPEAGGTAADFSLGAPPGRVTIEVVAEPDADPALVERLREAYDDEVAEPWLPVPAADLLLCLQVDDPDTFREPRLSLSELAEAAGLERRGDEVAHDESVWRAGRQLGRLGRIIDFFGEEEEAAGEDAQFVFSLADVIDGEDPEDIGLAGLDGVNPTTVRRALTALGDELVLPFVADELAVAVDDPGLRAWAEGLVDVLVDAATRSRDVAAARFLAARVAEGMGETLVAEQHLVLAEKADPENPAVIDRLAWYASDRGDAVRASRLWQRLDPTPIIEEDLAALAPFLEAATSAAKDAPGRNDPCWCGSGRKYKQCHLGELPVPSLADRVPWLSRKSVAYITRRLDRTEDDALAVAFARTVDLVDPSAVVESFQDPLVLDLVLTEGGWFDEFLTERGPLLPDDEALLAASWLLVDRSVHELVEAAPEARCTLRDLRTGETNEVADHAFASTAGVGDLYCLRVLPDGEGHQIVGGAFAVAAGTEDEVLALLDGGDPIAIARYVADGSALTAELEEERRADRLREDG